MAGIVEMRPALAALNRRDLSLCNAVALTNIGLAHTIPQGSDFKNLDFGQFRLPVSGALVRRVQPETEGMAHILRPCYPFQIRDASVHLVAVDVVDFLFGKGGTKECASHHRVNPDLSLSIPEANKDRQVSISINDGFQRQPWFAMAANKTNTLYPSTVRHFIPAIKAGSVAPFFGRIIEAHRTLQWSGVVPGPSQAVPGFFASIVPVLERN